jgi:hypothetical protein
MTRRKENILILICTLALALLLTLWRASILTMQEDTGPLPEGQRSMKPVDLYVGPDVKSSIDRLVTAFELAHGVEIKQSHLSNADTANISSPELSSSGLFLLTDAQKSLLNKIQSTWVETMIPIHEATPIEQEQQLILIHFSEDQADPNVIEVVNYLSATNQAYYLYSGKIE